MSMLYMYLKLFFLHPPIPLQLVEQLRWEGQLCDIPITCLDFSVLRFHVYIPTIFHLTNLSFVNTKCFQWKKTPGFYQQLHTRDVCDFQWYQVQWKTDMRNRTLWHSKKNRIGIWNRPSPQWNTIFKNNNNKKLYFFYIG